ncbi:MAG: metallopeptidase TldD-related protein [Elusimicrobiota bacterium]
MKKILLEKNVVRGFSLAILLLGIISIQVFAIPESDIVFKAMKDEMNRSIKKLKMENLQKPYYVAYYVVEGESTKISASFGSLESEQFLPFRHAQADVRIGDYTFDNANFASDSWEGYSMKGDWYISFENDYDSLRFALWSLTDESYKQALDRFSKKKAFVEAKNITEMYDDMSKEKPVETFLPVSMEKVDLPVWRNNIKELSMIFKQYPDVKHSNITFNFQSCVVRFLNTEGFAFKQPCSNGEIEIQAETYATDGFRLSGRTGKKFSELKNAPTKETLLKEVRELAEKVSQMAHSKTINTYIGPVLFEKDAAGKLFEQLFVQNVSFPREIWSPDGVYRRPGELVSRLGLRVLSPFLSVTDNPFERSYDGIPLMGYYEVDDEGVPAEKLTLVERGKLLNLYMSRAPIKEFKNSNGHARTGMFECPQGGPGNVFITPDKNSPKVMAHDKLKKKLIEISRELELEYGIIIRGFENFRSPFTAYKVNVRDGKEEPVHGI